MPSFPVEKKISELKRIFGKCDDLQIRRFTVSEVDFAIIYLDNLSDRELLSSAVIEPIIRNFNTADSFPTDCISAAALSEACDEAEIIDKLLNGAALLLFSSDDMQSHGYIAAVRDESGRSISEPETENVVRGPHEGFVESAPANAALLRRRIKTPALKYESFVIGSLSKSKIIVMYIDGTANAESLEILRARLQQIKTDSVLDSGYIESFITGKKAPFLPTVGNSERPDRVAAKLLEGRIAVICDGSPVVLTVPYMFCEALQSTEDYSKSTYYATFVRLIRFISLLLAVYTPAVFCALMYFHQPVFPLSLLLKIQSARKDLPFSLFIELTVILIAFEIIREVGIRMPRTVGDAVSIVASLILSDSAIEAGIASAPVIIIVAITAICNFCIPPYMNQTVLIRFTALIAARLFGFFGIAVFTAVLLAALCGIDSFGIPYMTPFAPVSATGLLDSLFMTPLKYMKKTPPSITGKNLDRR